MSRLFPLISALVLLLSLLPAQAERPPNILFILIDDLGWSDVGAYGSPYFDTPHVDKLASEGLRFTDAYAPSPACTPSRFALLTGQSPARTGITHIPWFNRHRTGGQFSIQAPLIPERAPDDIRTIAHLLKAQGYATGQWGKWHMANTPEEFGFDQGGAHKSGIHDFPGASTTIRANNGEIWERFMTEFPDLEPGEFLECELVDKAVGFINEHRDQPWFYYYDPLLVHTPILSRHKWLIDKYTERFERMGVTHVNPTYAAMVETMDWTVGQIIAAVEDLGLRDDTLIVFTSDNGGLVENVGFPERVTDNSPLYRGKVTMYEGGLRIPLIVDWPGVTRPGTQTDAVVDLIDFYPTLAEITGAAFAPGQPYDGVSLVPLLRDGEVPDREALFWHFPHVKHAPRGHFSDPYTPFTGVMRKGDWKLILSYADDSARLFNLATDIGEAVNLAAEQPDQVASMKRRFQAWLDAIGARMPVSK